MAELDVVHYRLSFPQVNYSFAVRERYYDDWGSQIAAGRARSIECVAATISAWSVKMSVEIKKIKGQLLEHPIGFVEIATKTGSVRFEREEAKQIREQYARYLDSKPEAGKWNLHIGVGEYDIEVEEPTGKYLKNG